VQSIVLGTAQWGSDYGITNASGRVSDGQLVGILRHARELNVRDLDTAAAYGDAELRLRPWSRAFRITTKVRCHGGPSIESQLMGSLDRLGTKGVGGCLIHDWDSLTPNAARSAARALENERTARRAERVGVSTYDARGLERALSAFDRLDIVQVPLSVLDQRLVMNGLIEELHTNGVEVQARSVFLQGLLVAPLGMHRFSHAHMDRFHGYCMDIGRRPIEVAVGFIRSIDGVSAAVLGVTSVSELVEIVTVWNSAPPQDTLPGIDALASDDEALIDPRAWA
jgi:aryl-alcohol dehydrogenase-like predicted oxidoreductase